MDLKSYPILVILTEANSNFMIPRVRDDLTGRRTRMRSLHNVGSRSRPALGGPCRSSRRGRCWWALAEGSAPRRPQKLDGYRAPWQTSCCQSLEGCPGMGAVVPPHVDEAVPRPAEVAGEMEAEAVEHAAAVPASIRRLHAAVVGLPVAHPALQRHILPSGADLDLTGPRGGE